MGAEDQEDRKSRIRWPLYSDWQTEMDKITTKKLRVNTPSLSCLTKGDPVAGGQELKGGLWAGAMTVELSVGLGFHF